ncbi:uncharacterized protein THITE_2108615 [Thermothielavioides terrestris NRRL 8126]|uniref:Uncharacterized protein n=1 Tax=Thermothielavioides terrestris (strain ATCC 38088 / NRRL 8126) TaxID=578455 RepID=G2QS17_THETT|nr:uncharacterized protein THITE_2108615 [Thermothielavioides terrestris NRRL 8126]AEO63407.1 hypothetical protein THITE_2108615 [Thermothielavioides terrestris NRRL 8126]
MAAQISDRGPRRIFPLLLPLLSTYLLPVRMIIRSGLVLVIRRVEVAELKTAGGW